MSRTIITSLSENFSSNPISFITGDSCIFLVEVVNERCVRSDTEYVTNLLTEFEGKIIIYIVDLWQKVENNPNQLENIKILDLTRTFPDTINHLSKNKVILLTQIPTYRPNVPELILSGKDVVKIKSEEWQNLDGVKILNSLYVNLNEQNLYLINIEKIFCDSFEIGYCVANTKNNLFYSDSKHLSIEGAELVTVEIIKILERLNS